MLWLGLVIWFCASVVPRALAGYRVHGLATDVADYALCMVGPTGPGLLRDNALAFQQLVRRRVVVSLPSERPFARCARGARAISGSVLVERAHLEPAAAFVEYGAGPGSLRVDELAVTIQPLKEAAHRAWPFVRGYTELVRPSLGAFEAIHPVPLPRPAAGHGLPAWRAQYRSVKALPDGFALAFGRGAHLALYKSSDGVAWRPLPVGSVALDAFAERCPAGNGRSFTLGTSADREKISVTSLDPAASTRVAELGPASATVYAVACDERALVALVHNESNATSALYLCPFGGRCAALPGPRVDVPAGLFDAELDVARVRGTTVLAATMHGIVRVTSSRDDGRTWTPFSVAFDAAEDPELHAAVSVPSRLLALDGRVFLYAGANKPNETYSVLVSDDHGASFRTPHASR